jgi:hypothetical protein
MPTGCYNKKGSNPPVCGAHGVKLERHQSSEQLITSELGDFEYFVCPVSGQVVNGAKTPR